METVEKFKTRSACSKVKYQSGSFKQHGKGETDITLSKLCAIATALDIEIKILMREPGAILMNL